MSRWDERLTDAVAWRRKTRHRWPSRRSADPDERRVANWLHQQRRLAKAASEDETVARRVRVLDRELPRWRAPQEASRRYEAQWRRTAREVAAYVDEHGHLPTGTDLSVKARRLATWLRTQRTAQRTGKNSWTSTRQEYLDRVAPGWDRPTPGAHVSPVSPRDRAPEGLKQARMTPEWIARADAVARHVQETGRFPSRTDSDPRARSLAGWLTNMALDERARQAGRRTRTGRSTRERAAYLDSVLPADWRDRSGRRGGGGSRSGRSDYARERQAKIDAITEMRAQGMNWSQIARARGVTPAAVNTFAQRHGID